MGKNWENIFACLFKRILDNEGEEEQKKEVREYQRFGGPAFVWDVRGLDEERDSSDFNLTAEKRRRNAGDHINPRHIKDGDTTLVGSVVGPTRGPVGTLLFIDRRMGCGSRFGYNVI